MITNKRSTHYTLSLLSVFWLAFTQSGETAAALTDVKFPGPQPGIARASQRGDVLTLENDVIAASWKSENGRLRPTSVTDKLSNETFEQSDTELFRLAMNAPVARNNGVFVAIRLEVDKVVAMASKDGAAWSDLATFPRAEFSGDPKLVRVGKMNLKAEAKDHYDHGPLGVGEIAELSPHPRSLASDRFTFNTGAHQAAVTEYAFPTGTAVVSCRIDKGTDQGMSWSPALALIWDEGKTFLLVGVRDKHPTFNITTAAGEKTKSMTLTPYPSFDLKSSTFRLASPPRIVRVRADKKAVRIAEQIGGVAIEADLLNDSGIRTRWRAELRDDSNYIRKTIEISSAPKATSIHGVELTDIRINGTRTIGTAPGCPVAAGNFFFGVEIPGSQNALGPLGARIGFDCKLNLSPTNIYTFGSVMGLTPPGQLRRSFLYYVERERARPSKPFLHYNCCYDLGYGLDEAKLLDVARSFDSELVKKRGVPVLSYLADDGWDNPGKGLWIENTRTFPRGFAGLNDQMKLMGAHLSVWISPLGGYGGANERTEWARKMGLIPADSVLDLSQPAYKQWFLERCLQLMREAGVNAFKWDKAGEGVTPHFMALLDVAQSLRKANPDLFINVTVGTWPSPFWLNHVDSTWRNGSADVGWAGKGNDPANDKFNRERWLTFRDGYCRHFFVEMSPLYPLNSVMHHGIVHGREFQGGSMGKTNPPDLKNEARSYFANGASLQELYLTPSMMTSTAWDQVAEAAKWSHANADVLVDAHWVGGDPLKLEVYGYAAWNPRKATLMIRNPDDKPQTMSLDAATVFDLPGNAPKSYALRSPYKDQRLQSLQLKGGSPQSVTLEPFEVCVFDATATR